MTFGSTKIPTNPAIVACNVIFLEPLLDTYTELDLELLTSGGPSVACPWRGPTLSIAVHKRGQYQFATEIKVQVSAPPSLGIALLHCTHTSMTQQIQQCHGGFKLEPVARIRHAAALDGTRRVDSYDVAAVIH